MTEVLDSNEEMSGDISIDDEAVWEAIRPGSVFKKYIKSTIKEPRHVDALSDNEEESSSRPSSPEVEILEVSKNKSHITVDLTLDDDDETKNDAVSSGTKCIKGTFQDLNSSPVNAHTSESAPVLDISDDETGRQEDIAILSTKFENKNRLPMKPPTSPSLTFRNEIGESYIKKPKLAWSSKFNEEDALSLILELESCANPPKFCTKQEGLDFLGSSNVATGSVGSISHGSVHAADAASSSQHVSSNAICDTSSNSQNIIVTNNHMPGMSSSTAATAVEQTINISQGTSSDSNQSSSLFVSPGTTSISVCNSATYSVPGYDGLRQTNNVENSFTTNCLPNKNHETADMLALSLLEADLPSDFQIPNSNSAFQTVCPGTARQVASDFSSVLSNLVSASTLGISDVLWNGGQSPTSSCGNGGNGVFVYASGNSWKPTFVSNADVLGSGAVSNSLQSGFKCPVTQSVNSVSYTGTLNGNNQQGLSPNAANQSWYLANSSNADHRQWSSSDSTTSQQSVITPVHENASFAASSQPSAINVDLSSSLSNMQPTDFVQTTENCASVLPVLSHTYISEQTSNRVETSIYSAAYAGTLSQAHSFGETKDDHKLNCKNASKTSADTYADPPSPEGLTISCHICLDSVKTIQSSSRQLCSTVCGHVFCCECLEASLKQKKECPMCRKKLNKNKYHPLFV